MFLHVYFYFDITYFAVSDIWHGNLVSEAGSHGTPGVMFGFWPCVQPRSLFFTKWCSLVLQTWISNIYDTEISFSTCWVFFFPFKGVCRFAQCAVYLNTWVIVASVVSEGALFMSLVLPVATVDWSKSNIWRLYISKKAFFFKHIMISWWPFFGLSLFGGRACQNCLFWTKFNLHLIIRSLQKALRFQKFHPSPHAFFLSYLLK